MRTQSELFKKQALHHLDGIYNMALWMSDDEDAAEELTFTIYEKGCRKYFDQFRGSIDLGVCLYRELITTFLDRRRKSSYLTL